MMVHGLALLLVGLAASACVGVPQGAYYAAPGLPAATRVGGALHRAAVAAGDDPTRYSFAFVQSRVPAVHSTEDRTFYVTDGLTRQADLVLEGMIAREVAHEVLGHLDSRRALTAGLFVGFTALGAIVPGAGLADLVVSPLAIRAFSRQQELAADQKAVEILRAMGYRAPRRTLAEALTAVHQAPVQPKEDLGGLLRSRPTIEEQLAALEPLEPPAPRGPHARRTP